MLHLKHGLVELPKGEMKDYTLDVKSRAVIIVQITPTSCNLANGEGRYNEGSDEGKAAERCDEHGHVVGRKNAEQAPWRWTLEAEGRGQAKKMSAP